MDEPIRRSLRPIIFGMFLCSGATSLVFETLWIRVLALGLGSTAHSISLVLAVFFSGTGFGSWLASRYLMDGDRSLTRYGWIEGCVGLYGLAAVAVMFHLPELLAALPIASTQSLSGWLVKTLLVAACLLLPAVGMGATLPLMIKAVSRMAFPGSERVATLYGVNTLGAAAGACATGFVLMPSLGVMGTAWSAAGVNLALCCGAWLLDRRLRSSRTVATNDSHATLPPAIDRSHVTREQLMALAATATCGLSSIACQVAWGKYLGIYFGTNILGTALNLSTFLLGLALGSFCSRLVAKRITANRALLAGLTAAGLGVAASSWMLGEAPVVTGILSLAFGSAVPLIAIKAAIAFLLMLPSTLAFGAMLPLAVRSYAGGEQDQARAAGVVYSVNTFAAILGSLGAGHLLIPLVGSELTVKAAIMGLTVTAATIILARSKRRRFLPEAIGIAALVTLTAQGTVLNYENIIRGAYVRSVASGDEAMSLLRRFFTKDKEELVHVYEGRNAVVSLSHEPDDGPEHNAIFRLKTNGLNESLYHTERMSILPRYEALLALLPIAFAASTERAFVVGYGGGYTLDTFASLGTGQVDVVELEEGILKAAEYVRGGTNPLLKRPGIRLRIEDARFALAQARAKEYDIIVSQPSHSWLSGVANLFTYEFFAIVKDNLKPGGVFAQWLNLYNLDVVVLRSILRTFYTVFPHGAVFMDAGDQELIMLGALEPLTLRHEPLSAKLTPSFIRDRLASVPIYEPLDVPATYAMSRASIWPSVDDAPLNTDRNAFAEARQSALFYDAQANQAAVATFLQDRFDGNIGDLLAPDAPDSLDLQAALLHRLAAMKKPRKLHRAMAAFETRAKANVDAWLELAQLMLEAKRYASAKEFGQKLLHDRPSSTALNLELARELRLGNVQAVVDLAYGRKDLADDQTTCYLIDALVGLRRIPEATEFMNIVRANQERFRSACGNHYNRMAGLYLAATQEPQNAAPFLETYYSSTRDDLSALDDLVTSLVKAQRYQDALGYLNELRLRSEVVPSETSSLKALFEQEGLQADAKVLSESSIIGH